MRLASWLCFGLAVVGALPAEARADDAEHPWADGVSPAAQAEALTLFQTGNRFFEQGQYAQALAIYRHAAATWDHPAIRYNMAVAHIHLDQPLEAYDDLVRVMRFGGAPLDAEAQAEVRTYQKLLLGQLAQLKVSCREPGAQVFLDGEQLMVGPGEMTRIVMPGGHQLVASKARLLTSTRALSLLAGKLAEVEIEPAPPPPAVHTERRWATWTPWAVLGGGAAIAIVGIPLRAAAASSFDDYERGIGMACPTGCRADAIPLAVREVRSRGELQNKAAIVTFAVGSTMAVAGLIMVFMNQPRVVDDGAAALVPAVVGGRPGVALVGAF